MNNNRVSKEDWNIYVNYISLDGPDGSGKSTLADIFALESRKYYKDLAIRVIKPASFNVSAKSQEIGEELQNKSKELKNNSRQHNIFFLRAMAINYEEVIAPLLRQGIIVICDSSEIRALAFMLNNGDNDAIEDTKAWIRNGKLTYNIQPSLRIVLRGDANTLLRNLQTKPKFDYGDPQNIQAVRSRIRAYNAAIRFIKEVISSSKIHWQNVTISHQSLRTKQYLSRIVNERLIPLIIKELL